MNKNYKRGMKDGATPFEDKFKKQEEKFRQTEGELRQEQSKLDSFLDDLLDVSEEQDKRITNIEDKANYGFNDVIDIKDLEDKDKKFLAGILMATCKRIKNINQQQKDFILGVLKYIDIKKPDLNISLENIENIESIQIQKAMLQVIMELMFIGEENFNFLNEYEDIFDYFSVNKKGFKDIKKSIQDMYDMVGIEGIYYKDEEELLDEEDAQKNQVEETESEEIEPEEIIIGKDFTLEDFETKEFKNKRVIINDKLEHRGILRFINSEIEFNNMIYYEGKLEFDGCKIIFNKAHYDEDDEELWDGICIKAMVVGDAFSGKINAKLVIKNCYITELNNKNDTRYGNYRENRNARIKLGSDRALHKNCSVEITLSEINGVENFLYFSSNNFDSDTENCNASLLLEESKFVNTKGYVLKEWDSSDTFTFINNCTFCDNQEDVEKTESILDLYQHSSKVIVANSNFYNINKKCLDVTTDKLKIEKCNFSNFLDGLEISYYDEINIYDCKFKNIKDKNNKCIIISYGDVNEKGKIENCTFENCGTEEEALKYYDVTEEGFFRKTYYTYYFAKVINCEFKNNLLHKE